MAKISVIVPIYNVEKYIRQSMAALVSQTMDDLEILCIDDCGTDGSMDIVREFAAHDTRIKIIRNPHNLGIADTRNAGLDAATSPFIMWCDPDDWYEPQMCAVMYDAINTNNADIAMCGTNVIYESDQGVAATDIHYFHIPEPRTVPITDQLVAETNVCLWNKIFRRAIIIKNNLRFPSGLRYEDELFFRAYMLYAQNITFITNKLYNYRRNTGSIMNKTFGKTATYWMDNLKVAIQYQDFLSARGLFAEKYEAFWRDSFLPAFKSAMRHALDSNAIATAYDTANEFISRTYTRPSDNFAIRHTIKLIQNKKLIPQPHRICGLFKYINDECRRELRLGPISLYKEKFAYPQKIICLLGIPFFKQSCDK